MAAAAVRNGLRAIADAVLEAPVGAVGGGRRGSLVRNVELRREVAANVAREVMQRGGSTAADLRALAVMVGARHVVSDERELREGAAEGHLPPQLVVSLALAPDSLTGHAKTIADKHIGECVECQGEVGMVQAVVRRVTLPRPVAPRAGAPAAADPPPAPEDPPSRAPAAEAKAAPPASAPARTAAPAAKPAAPARPAGRSRTRRLDPPETMSPWRAAWPVVAIGVVLLALFVARSRSEARADETPVIAASADRFLLSVPDVSDLPEAVDSAAIDLSRGDCSTAADRLTRGRQRYPDEPDVAWWAGVAQVCAGNGPEALESFDAFLKAGGHSSGELLWYQAQASLLSGDLRVARERLIGARPLVPTELGLRIDAQLEQLRTLTP